ncbi:MAG TPA: ABC-three component system protein [Acidobacteriaceae bacterium]|nr:ABC-three component system protein [Acidobacteriaceae bacterium]
MSFTDDALAAEHLRTYVRQLQLIEGSDEDVFEAIKQFLRAAAERSAWSKQGLVHDKSFDEYEEALISVWKNKRSVHDIIHKDLSDVDRGKLLLADSVSTSKSSRGWNRRFFLLRAASMPRLRTRLSAGTPNTKSFSAPERTMAILNREVRAIQNPALGAVLTWRAASSYPPGRYLRNSTPRIRSGSSKMRSCWTI